MKIEREVMERIVAHAERDAPIEACGFLMGLKGRITRDHPMTNAEGRADHFTFDPEEQFHAYKTAMQEGLDIIGAYHSHPAGPAWPSEEDIKLAYDSSILYVIVSLAGGERIVRGFSIRSGKVEEEPLTIEPTGKAEVES